MAHHDIPTVTVETPLGPMNAHINSGTVIVFNQSGEQVLTINQVMYRCYFGAELKDGIWQISKVANGRASSLHLNRSGSYKLYDYTHAALEKAKKVIGEWLPKWATEQTLLLAETEVAMANREYEAALSKVEATYKAYKDASTEEGAAIERLKVAETHLLNFRTLIADGAEAADLISS